MTIYGAAQVNRKWVGSDPVVECDFLIRFAYHEVSNSKGMFCLNEFHFQIKWLRNFEDRNGRSFEARKFQKFWLQFCLLSGCKPEFSCGTWIFFFKILQKITVCGNENEQLYINRRGIFGSAHCITRIFLYRTQWISVLFAMSSILRVLFIVESSILKRMIGPQTERVQSSNTL